MHENCIVRLWIIFSSLFSSLTSLSLLPSLKRPCFEIVKNNKNDVCPNFCPEVFDGKVCSGCFLDEYEISAWDNLSFLEKSYALEDALDRVMEYCRSNNNFDDDRDLSLLVSELKHRASVWRELSVSEKEEDFTILEEEPILVKDSSSSISIDDDVFELDATEMSNYQEEEDKSISFLRMENAFVDSSSNTHALTTTLIPRSIDDDNTSIVENPISEGDDENSILLKKVETNISEKVSTRQNDNTQQPPPPTPCTRICRYNSKCYGGKVCIGCFRDDHDIASWSGMSNVEKMFSLEDAADRCRDLSEEGDDDSETYFEGGITEAVLRSQAMQWGAWER